MRSYLLIIAVLFVSVERSSTQSFGDPPPLPDTGVRLYLGEELRVLHNLSIISGGQFHDNDDDSPNNSPDGLNDGVWCQSANTGDMIGTWYLPDGTQVSTIDAGNFPLHVYHVIGQIGLLRDMKITNYQGLYRCVIPDENGVNQTLWVAVDNYGSNEFDSSVQFTHITGETEFRLISTLRDADPPVFTLTFVVERRPPTNVTCTVEIDDGGNAMTNNIRYDDLSREVLASETPISIQVVVTIGMRQGGTYQCTVSNDASFDNTATTQAINVTVTNTPTNLVTNRIGLYQGNITWSPPVSNDPVVLGYELFYDLPNGTRESIEINGTIITVSTLDPISSYPVFVVAYGGDLPSCRSNNETLQQAVSIDVSSSSTLLIGLDITVSCIVNITIEVTVVQVVWTHPNFTILNKIDGSTASGMVDLMLSLDLMINEVQVSNAGIYICNTIINDTVGDVAMIERQYTLTVEIPPPSVITLVTPGTQFGRTFLSGISSLFCAVNVISIDLPPNIIFTWWGPQGQVTDDKKYDIHEGVAGDEIHFGINEDDYTHYSNLVIRDLTFMDNETQYYCRVQVGVNDTFHQSTYVIPGTTTSENVTVLVEDIPDPVVIITPTGSGNISDNYTLMCSVDIVDDLLNIQLNITFLRITDGSYEMLKYIKFSGDAIITVNFTPLRTSDSGRYRFSVDMRQATVDYQDVFNESFTINTTIPAPEVVVTTDPPDVGILVEGTYIDLVCTVTINDAVDTDVNVNIEWSRNGGSTLMNSSDYSISPISLISGQYISIIRIEELMMIDNGATYTCSVSIQPSSLSSYISGSNGYSSITLSVEDFTVDNVMINIDFPSIPTAGDEFNFTCRATVPERLVRVPNGFIISYDLAGNVNVVDGSTTVAQSSLMRNGNLFSRDITLNPVKTSDATNYFCIVVFEDLGTTTHNNKTLIVKISSPNMSLILSPNDTIYESTALNITCTATLPSVVNTPVSAIVSWIYPSNETITSTNDSRVTVLPAEMISVNTFESILIFHPFDNGDEGPFDDQGEYTCEMTISSTDYLILNGVDNITENITVEELPPFELNISTSGDAQVGLSFKMTCSVRVVEGLVQQPNVTWMKMDDVSMGDLDELNITTITVIDGSVTNVTVMLDPVLFEHRGVYICMAEFNIDFTNDADSNSQEYILIVDFPPFTTEMTRNYLHTLYAGTPLTLTCNITLDDLVDIPVIVTNQWTRNMMNITEPTITESLIETDTNHYTATLDFYPLSAVYDNGEYKCTVLVTADTTDNYITNNIIINDASTDVVVEDLPNLEVVTAVTGIEIPGNPYSFTCTVTVVDRLIVSPAIKWSKEAVSFISEENYISVYPIRYEDQLFLEFEFLDTSDAGKYTCEATVTISEISVTVTNSSVEVLQLQIPVPSVVVTHTQEYNNLLAGSTLTIYCDIAIDVNVDTPFNVTSTWTHDNTVLLPNSRMMIIDPYSTSLNEYQSHIEFSTLSSTIDSGVYTCNVSVASDSNYLYVFDAENVDDTTAFSVIDPEIANFTVIPDYFLGVETTCPESLPLGKFLLTCVASTPEIVVPELEVIWLHNGVERTDNSEIVTNGTHIVNTLNFKTTTYNDTGNYTCISRIIIPDSSTIQLSEESNIIIRAARHPFVPVNVTTTVAETTATITFIIPAIAYTPEIYYIQYIGLELQNVLRSSTPVIGPDDITVINATYSITLSGLEEANTYEFTVVSTNCIGNVTTEVMDFTTLPALPVGSPIHCTNTTFLPRTVTLNWTEPERAFQNGDISGYYLQCQIDGSDIQVPDVNSTQDNPNTNYTIPVLIPFTSYSCLLAAINQVGTGPPTMCVFTTAQDIPEDAPENFVSTPSTFNVTFHWLPPSLPNGIIIQYNLTVDNINTGTTTTYIIDNVDDHYTVGEFKPYQRYSASLSAATVVGYGPPAHLLGRTESDIPGAVSTVNVNVLNISTIQITWLPVPQEEANGNITHYIVSVSLFEGRELYNRKISVSSHLHVIVNGLFGEIPYGVTVKVNNDIGLEGQSNTTVFFTREGIPPVPTNISVLRLNGTHMNISWALIPITEARGFIKSYLILYLPNDNRRRQISSLSVPATDSSVVIGGLDPDISYSVSISASTNVGQGKFTNVVFVAEPESSLFQLRAGPFSSCEEWTITTEDSIKSFIHLAVADTVIDYCDCGFLDSFITNETLLCDTQNPTQAVYRAQIFNFGSISSTQIVSWIEYWVLNGASVTSGPVLVTFDPTCPVPLNSFNDEICQQQTNASTHSSSSVIVIIGSLSAVGLSVLLCNVVIIIIILSICFKSKQKRLYTDGSDENKPESVNIELTENSDNVNVELTGNTAYRKVEFQTNETMDHTYESLENYANVRRANEVNVDTYDHPPGRDNTPEEVNVESTDTSNQTLAVYMNKDDVSVRRANEVNVDTYDHPPGRDNTPEEVNVESTDTSNRTLPIYMNTDDVNN